MKEFDQASIDGAREHFESVGFSREEANVGEFQFHYYVLPQELNPNLADFAMRRTRTLENGQVAGVFGVSDSVPKELRPYWAAHEYAEFTKIGISTQGRCKASEEIVLGLIPQNLKELFIGRRVDFFTNLVTFFEEDLAADTGNYTPDDLEEVKATLSYLKVVQEK